MEEIKLRKICNYCGQYYKSSGKFYCSRICMNSDPSHKKILSESGKKRWTPEERKKKSDLNKKLGIKPPGFKKGHKLNVGQIPWNKGKPRSEEDKAKMREGQARLGGSSGDKNNNWRGGKVDAVCINCGSVVQRYPSIAKTNKYCSYQCAGIYRMSRDNPKSGTLIERLMEQELLDRKMDFIPQKPLFWISIADFYLPQRHVAIFCDGDYWRNLPGCQERDAKQTKLLESKDVKVFRFWEHRIKLSVKECVDEIEQWLLN